MRDPVEIEVDLTPPGHFVFPDDFDTESVVDQEVPISDGGDAIGTGTVVRATVINGRLIARLRVSGAAAMLVAEPLDQLSAALPVILASMAEFEQSFGSPAGFFSLGGGAELAEPAFTVGRHGGTYSVRRVLLGGFRTRSRIRKLRLAAALARSAPHMVRAQWDMLDSALYEEDNQRVCPHAPRWRTPLDRETDICATCGTAFPRRGM